jgi:hydrogenase nickel incorporation protein HypA/HybF
MHELAITRGLLSQVLAEAGRRGAKRITAVNLVAGEQSGVVPDCVKFYFDQMKAGTPAASAELRFRTEPLRIRCPKCGRETGGLADLCGCNAGGEVVAGGELVVESIDIE